MNKLLATTFRRARKFARLAQNKRYRHGLRHGIGAAIEHQGAIQTLNIKTLIDVGANVGQFSLLVHALHPSICVHAFEPLPRSASQYRTLFKNLPYINLHTVAVGEFAGSANIYVSKKIDSSSLLPITALQEKIFPGTAHSSTEIVPIVRIDDILDGTQLLKPILIKLDIQGFELSALKGMTNLLRESEYVYTEVSFKELYQGQPLANEIITWLNTMGYQLSGVYNTTTADDGSSIQADMLFTKSLGQSVTSNK